MLKVIREYHLDQPFMWFHSVPVSMGPGREKARLFFHTNTPGMDPWSEYINWPKDTMKISLFTDSGKFLWTYDIGTGTFPGTWFAPLISFDLDGDGVDEIWTLGNTQQDLPFTMEYRTLQRIDPLTGKQTGEWPWPDTTRRCRIDHMFRFYLICGHVHGKPVLITAQGTYEDEYLQAYDSGMNQIWSIKIDKDDKGARASHHTIVFDINNDGVDELFYGERVISLEDGHEIACGDKGLYWDHSDILNIFEDPETGKRYVFTAREGQWTGPDANPSRVVLYDDKMNTIWRWNKGGHMHDGWLASVEKNPIPEGEKVVPGENRKYIAFAFSFAMTCSNKNKYGGEHMLFYFDALTGEPIENPFWGYRGDTLKPIDINGDGYSEFLVRGAQREDLNPDNIGDILDRHGKKIGHIDGSLVTFGKLVDGYYGQQMMISDSKNNTIRIYADDEAVPGPCDKYPEYHELMQHMMGSGYQGLSLFGI